MASNRIPNGSMIGQFGSAAITPKSDTISNFLFGMMSGRLVNQTRRIAAHSRRTASIT